MHPEGAGTESILLPMTKSNILMAFASQGILKFRYRKKDGAIRVAYGTTKAEIIAELNEEAGSSPESRTTRSRSDATFSYYDIACRGWRSFIFENFIDFDTNYSL